MKTDFKVLALPRSIFEPFFSMSDEELRGHHAAWIEVKESPGCPCRVTLEDAKVGERVLAISFTHLDANSPYRSSGPIFIRENAQQASFDINQLPSMLRHRKLSIRAYDSDAIMLAADVMEGRDLEENLVRYFENPSIEYIDVHNAEPGCFNCRVIRA